MGIIVHGDELSELKVLKSNAGFYVGRTSENMPYSRQTGYYDNITDAEIALKNYPEDRRDCLENYDLYALEDELFSFNGV